VRVPFEVNRTILEWVGERAQRDPMRIRLHRRIHPSAMRCDDELRDRLQAMGEGLTGVRMYYLEGLPTLLHPSNAIFAIAGGASWVALRIPQSAHGAVVPSGSGKRGLEGDWIDVDPWLTDLEAVDGTRRARGWTRSAYFYVGEMVGGMRP
jgi:hypothetical protein